MNKKKLHFRNGLTFDLMCGAIPDIYKFTTDMKEFFDCPYRCKRCEQVII